MGLTRGARCGKIDTEKNLGEVENIMLNDKNELKILALMVVADAPDGLNPDALMSAMLDSGCGTLTEIADVFEELLSKELLALARDENGAKCCILTDMGKTILPELASVLTGSVSEQAKRGVLRAYEALTGGMSYSSLIEAAEKAKNGKESKENAVGVYLICTAKRGTAVTAQVRLFFENRNDALTAQRNFERRPQAVINAITASVTGNADFLM